MSVAVIVIHLSLLLLCPSTLPLTPPCTAPPHPSPPQIITTLPHERFIVNRERSSNTYRLSAYYLSKVLTEWPFRAAPIVLVCCIVYWPVQLQRTAAKFLLFTVTAVLEYTTMNATGLLVRNARLQSMWPGVTACHITIIGAEC